MNLALPVLHPPARPLEPVQGSSRWWRQSAAPSSPPARRPGRPPLQAEDMRRVVLLSQGTLSHYELGLANGLAYNRVPVTMVSASAKAVPQLSPGVSLLDTEGEQERIPGSGPRRGGPLRERLRVLRAAWGLRHCTFMIAGKLQPGGWLGLLQGALLRMMVHRLTVTVHDLLPRTRPGLPVRAAFWLFYRLPHRLLVHAEATRRALIEDFGIRPGRIFLMQQGLHPVSDRMALTREQARQQLGLPAHGCIGLFFGHVSSFKGLDLVLDALPQVPELTLLVAGHCSQDAYGQAMRRRLEALGQEGQVRWIDGFLDEDTIAHVFTAADCTLLPYRQPDRSGVLPLSLAQGVPVLATRAGGFSEVVHAGNGACIDEPSVSAVARALRAFLGERERYQRSEVLRSLERLQWQRTVEPLVEWLRQEGASVS